MKIRHLALVLGISCATIQADAQIGKRLLERAIQAGAQAASNKSEQAASASSKKKADQAYQELADAANEALANGDLRYFCVADRKKALRIAAGRTADVNNKPLDDKIQAFLDKEGDLNNPDRVASCRGLLARSKAESDIPTSNYLFACAKIQYTAELKAMNPETLPLLQDLYDEIMAYENTFTNGRDKGEMVYDPSQINELLAAAAQQLENNDSRVIELSDYEKSRGNASSSSQSDAKGDKQMEGEIPDLYNNNHEWKDKDGNFLASVSQDGSIYRSWGNRDQVCQIKRNGEIWVRGNLWGQVMRESRYFVIYQFDRYSNNKPVRRGTVEPYGNGTVIWEYETLGHVEGYAARDRSGNYITNSNLGNTSFVHRAVAFFLYNKIK